MALASSSPSSSALCRKWDVFISFRGKDTREGVVSHLFEALKRKGINTFLDDKLRKGDQITPALLETIQESYVSIVVFSENYADSPWCLDELVKIFECMISETSRQIAIPIFYKVDPSDVRELGGRFGQAFHQLKEKSKDGSYNVEGWIDAMRKISNLSGWDLRNIKSESELVEGIANDIQEKLSHLASDDPFYENLVGIDSRARNVESLLNIDSVNDNRTIGIWGMGGIGKTTLAGKVFNRIKAKFDSYLFVDNVKEEIRKQSPIALRDFIIRKLLGERDLHIGTPFLDNVVRRRLQSKKVLLVFDDVDDPNQLKELAGEGNLYGKGSRIIVTSRDKQVLKNVCLVEEYVCEVRSLLDAEALQLFCLHAFKQNNPKEEYVELSMEAIRIAQGNPLALRVFGSNLYSKGPEEWESEVKKLKSIPDLNVQKVLRASYDGLGRNEQNMFLDIACFFKGECKDKIKRILEGCGFHVDSGIRCLIDKSLITISNGEIYMHDLLQQMGKEIVCEEYKQPGGCSRLFKLEDIDDVLSNNTGPEKVEGILLEYGSGDLEINSSAFRNLRKLRILKILSEDVLLLDGLEFLPKELRYLYWYKYPWRSLPLNCCRKLVELHMPWSQLQQLLHLDKRFTNLTVMDLSNSDSLIRISDLSGAVNLKVLKLRECKSLVEIPSSLKDLSKLTELDLSGCTNLCRLPSCLHLKNLEVLRLTKCKSLVEIPTSLEDLSKLTELDLAECTNLCSLPSFLHLKNLEVLKLMGCESLVEIPSSLEDLPKLIELHLRECTNLCSLPSCLHLKNLDLLDLQGCSKLRECPPIPCNLKYLFLGGTAIGYLPDNLGYLESLYTLDTSGTSIKTLPSSINQLRKLTYLYCSGCHGLTTLPLLNGLFCLETLELRDCGILEIPESIGSLESLGSLDLSGNCYLERIPASIKLLSQISHLILDNCKKLRDLPELPHCLKVLGAAGCSSLESVSSPLPYYRDYPGYSGRQFEFCNCDKLDSKTIVDRVFADRGRQKPFCLCIPGVEAPQGMKYTSPGSSIRLDHRGDNRRIIAFYFFAVFDPKFCTECWGYSIHVTCTVDFKDESGNTKSWNHCTECNSNSGCLFRIADKLDLPHVFLWKSDVDSKGRFTEVSFQLETMYFNSTIDKYHSISTDKGIMKCGVHPIYEADCVGTDKKREEMTIALGKSYSEA